MREEQHARANKEYMSRMLAVNAEETKKSSDQDHNRKKKALENQQFLMDQMRMSPTPAAMSVAGDAIRPKKKQHLGGMMKPEEARMNRALLQEIARVKRGDQPTSLLTQQRDNPI